MHWYWTWVCQGLRVQNIEYFLTEEINERTNSKIPPWIGNLRIFHFILDIQLVIVTVSLTRTHLACPRYCFLPSSQATKVPDHPRTFRSKKSLHLGMFLFILLISLFFWRNFLERVCYVVQDDLKLLIVLRQSLLAGCCGYRCTHPIHALFVG